MRRFALATVLTLLLSALPGLLAPAAAAGVTHKVTVTDHSFTPAELHIEPGDTVVWTFLGAATHTVTAEDGSFHSGQQASGTFTWSHRVEDGEGRHPYLCQIHGSMGMTGVIVVGDPPPVEELVGTVFVPSDGIPLEQAIDRAAPGSTVVLEPGTHQVKAPLELTRPGVTVRGGIRLKKNKDLIGDVAPEEVLVTSPGAVPYAFVVSARGDADATQKPVTTIADLTVTGFRLGGVRLRDAEGFALQRVHLTGSGWDHGVVARGSSRGTIEQLLVSGARYAGISIQQCRPCDTSVRGSTVSGSFTGVELTGSTHGIEIATSTLTGNAAGIVAYTGTSDGVRVAQGVVIRDNVIGSPSTDVPHPTVFQPENLPPGAGPGIWLAAATDSWVLRNTVTDHRYGVAVTARIGTSDRVMVESNVVDRSVQADLAWDGIGRDTCFTGNTTSTGDVPTSSPAQVQTLYPCNRSTVGVPNPTLQADLVLGAWQTYGEQALESL